MPVPLTPRQGLADSRIPVDTAGDILWKSQRPSGSASALTTDNQRTFLFLPAPAPLVLSQPNCWQDRDGEA